MTITLKDVNEKPTFDAEVATDDPPANVMSVSVPENTTTDFASYSVTDQDGDNITWSLMGVDGSKFMLGPDGNLSFRSGPDFEDPTDADGNNRYQVTVRASDGTLYDDRMVTVTVTDAPEAPEIDELDGTIKYAENGTDPVVTLTATDPEDDTIMWSLPAGDADDQDNFSIDEDDGILTFAIGANDTPPDFENPVGGSGSNSNTYNIQVQATDGENPSTIDITVEVTNVAEAGMITWTVDPDGDGTLTPATVNGETPIVQFQPGADLTVTELTDGDMRGATKTLNLTADPAVVTWQWYRSSSKTSQGTAIDGATTNTYMVQDEARNSDIGRYIRVVASYSVTAGRLRLRVPGLRQPGEF